MKVRLLQDELGPGPEFGRLRPDGTINHDSVVRPAGTIIDHPKAWLLCFGRSAPGQPIQAEPVDEEAIERVELQKNKIRLMELELAKKEQEIRRKQDEEAVAAAAAEFAEFEELLTASDEEFEAKVNEIKGG